MGEALSPRRAPMPCRRSTSQPSTTTSTCPIASPLTTCYWCVTHVRPWLAWRVQREPLRAITEYHNVPARCLR